MCLGSYSRTWDLKLQALIAENRFRLVDDCTAKLGGVEIWYENHPYGSFTLSEGKPSGPFTPRPSRSTIMFAMEMLLNDLQNQNNERTKTKHQSSSH